ncbi:biotin--[acetyl-CoA-carboxylase] ligase [Paludisphaera rhizosphaerae]|uniref:biotin--[acetyl-CoA-carboxylase] ligase n=1 Tax=Paludisphaera rhizosphaerae TaxID=2711216 RepID=UPI001F111907|nr:biotin--[acetyl-CoA-carboxylase] ligase [Paludisphaera rhizosphaerae]
MNAQAPSTWADPKPPALNIPLLDRLREAGGSFVPLAELSGDPAADVAALAAFGFNLERREDGAIAYRGPSPRLCPDQIEHDLGTIRIGRRVAVWRRIGSTNDAAARGASTPANDGLVVMAEEQTAGRGRRGRAFVAPAGSSLLTSILLFPPDDVAPGGAAWLTVLAAVAVAEVVSDRTGRPGLVKWPNDVRVDGRKICGVLVERMLRPPGGEGPTSAVVVGIGLNVNIPEAAFPPAIRDKATSLSILAGRDFDRSELARDLLRRLDRRYDETLRNGPAALSAAWRDRCEHLGRPVRVLTSSDTLEGTLTDVDLESGLTLTSSDCGPTVVQLDAVLALEPATA